MSRQPTDRGRGASRIGQLVSVCVLAFLSAACTNATVTSGATSTEVNGLSASVVASCKADAKAVETATEAYHAQVGSWPSSLAVLTQTATMNGQALGPWLRQAPSNDHYTIVIDSTNGGVYVYPPNSGQPSTFDQTNSFDTGDPCSAFAS